ncbi:2-nitropropane dioxygenase, partial [Mycena rebaudengoi]
LGLTTPVVVAPMAFASTPELTSSISSAGGLGTIGADIGVHCTLINEKMATIRTSLSIARGDPLPIAIGFIGWILDITEQSDDPRLPSMLDEFPIAIWFAFGLNLGKYMAQVRSHDQRTMRKTFIFVIINSIEDARRVVLSGADAVVVQDIEAGGHGGVDAPPLFDLLKVVLSDIQSGLLILAAGGRSTGAQIASLLTMYGVVLGTRFLFTPECAYSPAKKDVLVKAGFNATVRTLAFDEVNRTNGWPPNCDGRAITNNIMEDCKAGLSLEERIKKFDESNKEGDNSHLIIWAGVGASLTTRVSRQ